MKGPAHEEFSRESCWAQILCRRLIMILGIGNQWLKLRRARVLIVTLAGAGAVAATGCAARIKSRPTPPIPTASLFVETRGQQGTPVVLLHGLVGSGRYWDGALPYLQDDHRVIVPDLLGFGRSPKPKVSYSVQDHLTALHEAIKGKLGDDPVFLVGHSMGSLLAIEYALAYPNEVCAVVLVCPPLFDSPEDARRKVASISPMTARFVFHPLLARVACRLHEALGPIGRRLARLMNRKMPVAVAEDAAAHTWESFSGSLRHVVLERDLSDLLPRLQGVPILILHGESDRLAETEKLGNLAHRVGAEFISLPGDHHLLLRDERPAMDAIATFLNERPARVPAPDGVRSIQCQEENNR